MKRSSLCRIFVCLTLFSFSSVAQANLGIEPYAGYGLMGTNSAGSQSDTYTGFGLGAKVDYTFMNLIYVGVDGAFLPALSYTTNNAGMGLTGTSSTMKVGAVAGLKFGFPLRIWVGYNFIDNLNLTGTQISIPITYQLSGSSFKFGAGFSVIPLLSINVEYFMENYSSLTMTALGATSTQALTGTNAFSGGFLFVSASVPISIGS